MNSTVKNFKSFIEESQINNEIFDVNKRIEILIKLKKWIVNNKDLVAKALKSDLNKSEIECYLSEMMVVINQLNFYIKNIKKFFKPKKVKTNSIQLLFTKNYVNYKPRGTVLLINPYNYPFHLTMIPLITALASGNYVIIKNSPKVQNINDVLRKMIKELSLSNVCIFMNDNADKKEIFEIISYKPGLMLFTGGKTFGLELKKICDEHNVKSILELGSSCPVIVDKSADIQKFSRRIWWAKLFNSGQTCVSPNSIFIHKDIYESTLKALNDQLNIQCLNNKDYDFVKMIDINHLERILNIVKKHTGLELEHDKKSLKIVPKIIEVEDDNPLLYKEIFGPIFFVTKINDVKNFVVQNRNKINNSLSTYVFSENVEIFEFVKNYLNYGNISLNEALIHVNNINLPFGGVLDSGNGKYHGYYGLIEFSFESSICIGSKKDNMFTNIRFFNNVWKETNRFKKMIK